MPTSKQSQGESENAEIHWRSIYVIGGVFTIITLIGVTLDVIIGNVTGGNLSALPQTAVERFAQFQANPWLGLYNLNLLNTIN
jgi:hypothetical protein